MGTKRPWVVEVFNLWRQARDVPQMCHECGMMFSRPKCRAGQLIRRSWWGTGIYHSEHNLAKEPLRFIQCWVVPCKCTGRYWKCHNAKTIWVWWFDWWFLSVSRWLVQPESEVSVVQNGSNQGATLSWFEAQLWLSSWECRCSSCTPRPVGTLGTLVKCMAEQGLKIWNRIESTECQLHSN